MNSDEYRRRGKEMIDYIADYLETIRDRRVYPDVHPGYMKDLLPSEAPIDPEPWDRIMSDFEGVVMPGVTHWQSPHMHGYYPCLNSYPSLLGDMLSDAINCLGFTWASSPACTELELIVTDWLGKMIGLPSDFLHYESNGKGGGVFQTTSSEATLICLLAGRSEAIRKYRTRDDTLDDAQINSRLVAYCSDQAHSSVEKAGLIGLVKMRYIESDDNCSMRLDSLLEAIEEDKKNGLIPFFLCATLGTTGVCSFDNIQALGPVCECEQMWLHIDAAYAGTALICPEYRHWIKGIEYVDSFAFTIAKWMMVNFDAAALWVKDCKAVHRTFTVDPLYLQHENSGLAVDYMHWQIPLSKKFRALKIWFVIRNFGVSGLQKHIREGVRLAQKFEALVLADPRFEVPMKRHLGLTVFRLIGENILTERLLKRLNSRGNIHCVPASIKGKYVIRFTVTSQNTLVDDIVKDWLEIKNTATVVLSEFENEPKKRVPLAETKKNELFGSSLLLANSPMSPKIVNGSFAAVFDHGISDWTKGWYMDNNRGSPARRRLFKEKQFSLDSRLDLVQYCLGLNKTVTLPTCSESRYSDPTPRNESSDEEVDPNRRSKSMEEDECSSTIVCAKCGHVP